MDKMVILVVDDMATNVFALEAILEELYEIKTATSGEEALELAIKQPIPDLILLDVEMPGMNGYEVCKKLKSDSKTVDIPVIFVTSNDETAQEEEGLLLGAVDYVTKPIRPAIVKARIKTHLLIKEQRDKLISLAMHDQLTTLYNRHYLVDEGERKFARSKRRSEPLSLIMADIDFFKKINDTYGHLMGDKILQNVAKTLKNGNRGEDFVARYGGEEFVILLENCNLESAVLKAEQLRQEIMVLKTEDLQVTMSFGVIELTWGFETFDALLKAADDALYEAKESGRNQVKSSSLI
jgi:diguanylate cyclase (GGDEF)-like protein